MQPLQVDICNSSAGSQAVKPLLTIPGKFNLYNWQRNPTHHTFSSSINNNVFNYVTQFTEAGWIASVEAALFLPPGSILTPIVY